MAGSSQKGQGNVQEVIGDLFSCPDDHALANCISSDIEMGKGINVLFKKKFHGYQELWDQYQYPGGCAILEREGRFIYYLVTKMRYWEKPTYKTLTQSLEKMRDHNLDNGVKQLAMPKIGCGLDKLHWPKVRRCINDVYKGTDVSITVYHLDGEKTGQCQPGQRSRDYSRENSGNDRQGGWEKDRPEKRRRGDKSEQHRRASSGDRRENSGGDHHGGGEKGRPEKRRRGERSEEHPRGSSDDHGEGTSQRREDAPKEYNSGRNNGEGGSGQRDDKKSSQDKRDDSKHHDDQERDKQASDETGIKKKREKNKKKKGGEKVKSPSQDGCWDYDDEPYVPNVAK